ncbi:uncharacterized protein TNCV_4864321 [Trichonephila clavipes]|nr:uncharacterized protein TNCV_4864321 [Trichonephila clavipes]
MCEIHIDFTGLYPWVNKYCEYPVGHPEIITEDFRDIDSYFGLPYGGRTVHHTGTWVTEEIYEVYHFQSSSNDLFRSYIDLFLKIKQEASGYPKGCLTDQQKSEYIISYSKKENISLDKNSINVNLGRRSVAKLALNSFWGRWGMNLNKNKLTFVSTVHDFNKMLMDKTKDIPVPSGGKKKEKTTLFDHEMQKINTSIRNPSFFLCVHTFSHTAFN